MHTQIVGLKEMKALLAEKKKNYPPFTYPWLFPKQLKIPVSLYFIDASYLTMAVCFKLPHIILMLRF